MNEWDYAKWRQFLWVLMSADFIGFVMLIYSFRDSDIHIQTREGNFEILSWWNFRRYLKFRNIINLLKLSSKSSETYVTTESQSVSRNFNIEDGAVCLILNAGIRQSDLTAS
jgi:hypothetical protein